MIYIFTVLLGISSLYMVIANRVEAYIKTLIIQGILLFAIMFSTFLQTDTSINHDIVQKIYSFLVIIFETLIFRVFILPIFLRKITLSANIHREHPPTIPHFYSFFIAISFLIFGLYISFITTSIVSQNNALFFGVGIAIILISLFTMINRKQLVTHIISYVMLENGIFLLSTALLKEMPLIVTLGMLLDIFLGIFLLGFVLKKIYAETEKTDVETLQSLRD